MAVLGTGKPPSPMPPGLRYGFGGNRAPAQLGVRAHAGWLLVIMGILGELSVMATWTAVLAIGSAQTGSFPVAFAAVYGVGFLAAVVIGSIAWYNSKRPAGWEGRERPDIVPEVKSNDESGDA